MKRNKLFIALCLLLTSSAVTFGQLKDYNYIRPVNGVQDQWHKVELPDDVYNDISESLYDLRIIKINNSDTLEIPYLIKAPTAEREDIAFEVINKTQNNRGYYYTFKVGEEESIDNIQLDFREDNFDLKVTLEGSQDQNEWFGIVDEYRILSIKNNLTNYQFTQVRFPKSQFRYFRLLVQTASDPGFQSAGISQQLPSNRQYRNYKPENTNITINKESKQTILLGDLAMPVPVSSLKIEVEESIDYYRTFKIEYLRDSFNTEKGWKHNYQSLYRGTLSSLENNTFRFQTTIAQRFKVVIENNDNRPLLIEGFEAVGEVNELIARFDEPENGNYYLLYGNPIARRPNYDIKNFQSSIPDNLSGLTIGVAEKIFRPTVTKNPLFENQLWLWVVMIIVIGLLGWFSVKMMKGK